MSVYLIHFIEPYKHAAHYTGFSPEVQARVNAHLNGKGARLTEVVHEAGIQMVLVRVWEDGDRKFERKLKNGHIRRHCPICRGEAVQMPLLLGEPAYVGNPLGGNSTIVENAPAQLTTDVDEAQISFDDYHIELRAEELEEYIDDIADREFWRSGCW